MVIGVRTMSDNIRKSGHAVALPLQVWVLESDINVMTFYVRRLLLGDALVCSHGRLERRQPIQGMQHYMLYQNGQPVGVQYVRGTARLDEIQRKLAARLIVAGFTPHNVEFLQGTKPLKSLSFEHNRLLPLVQLDDEPLDEE